jgi:predicted dehydrogenase
VVSGLGLIGLLAVQILRANGCQVLGIDFDARKLALARMFGAETCDLAAGQDSVTVAEAWTNGIGVDAVLVTASTKSDELIHQAATMCRQRGRIVLVGVVGLNLQRSDFYEKELSFQVSCSYGPGRYDVNYEKRGLDYPIGFARWTEQRNFEAVLQLMADSKIDVKPLITHRFAFDEALTAYQTINDPGTMGILLQYQESKPNEIESTDTGSEVPSPLNLDFRKTVHAKSNRHSKDSLEGLKRDVGVAFLGAGGFTTRMLLPLLPKTGIQRCGIISSSGVSASHAAKKYGFKEAFTDSSRVMEDPNVDALFIATPHNMHARMTCESLLAGKHVFVEKPLAMTTSDLSRVEECLAEKPDRMLMVGFNRRFSPHMVAMKDWLRSVASNMSVIITVNAGKIPGDHWTQDPEIGGGRIVGEACHFIDLARFLVGHRIISTVTIPMIGGDGRLGDCVTIGMTHDDGSNSTVHYLSNGSKDFPKERIEVFAGGKVLVCDNFRESREIGGKRSLKTRKQDKGHAGEIMAFLDTIKNGGPWPIPADELLEVSRIAIECQAAI